MTETTLSLEGQKGLSPREEEAGLRVWPGFWVPTPSVEGVGGASFSPVQICCKPPGVGPQEGLAALSFHPPWPLSPSGQYELEKDGKTHKNLPNKTNMWCRQSRAGWDEVSFGGSPMGCTRQKWLVAAEKCVISCSQRGLLHSVTP